MTVLDIIKRAMRLNGSTDANSDPSDREANDALMAYNQMVRGLFGTVIGPRVTPQATSVSRTAQAGRTYVVGTAAVTITLPYAPRPGARVGVADGNNALATYNTTLARNRRLIEGSATNKVLNTNGYNAVWFYRVDTANWTLEEDQDLTDTPYFQADLIARLPWMLAYTLASEFGAELRPEVAQQATEGRQHFQRIYGRNGRVRIDKPLGSPVAPN